MSSENKWRMIFGIILVIAFILVGCTSTTTSRVDSADYSMLEDAAYTTYENYKGALSRGELEQPAVPDDPAVPYEPEIPKQYWAEKIKALTPLRVYRHSGMSIVVVQKEDEATESGLYIIGRYSSSIPIEDGESGEFQFKKVYENLFEYTRKHTNHDQVDNTTK